VLPESNGDAELESQVGREVQCDAAGPQQDDRRTSVRLRSGTQGRLDGVGDHSAVGTTAQRVRSTAHLTPVPIAATELKRNWQFAVLNVMCVCVFSSVAAMEQALINYTGSSLRVKPRIWTKKNSGFIMPLWIYCIPSLYLSIEKQHFSEENVVKIDVNCYLPVPL